MKHLSGCAFAVALFLVACAGRVQVDGADSTLPDTKVLDVEDLGQQLPDARTSDAEARNADVPEEDTPAGEVTTPGCKTVLPLQCGGKFSHSTVLQGHPDQWSGYACTQRLESGPEVIYSFHSEADCQVSVRLEDLSVDLDLLVLDQCDPWSCTKAASTPLDIQDGEKVVFDVKAGGEYFVVVDGYAGASGTYEIAVECKCSAELPSLTDGSWEMHVDRKLKGLPGDVQFPTDPLDEEDYEPVDDGPVYPIVVSGDGKFVAVGDTPLVGTLVPTAPGEWMFTLDEGTFAGGRFVVWSTDAGLQAELTIYGSGVPMVSSERGALVKGK